MMFYIHVETATILNLQAIAPVMYFFSVMYFNIFLKWILFVFTAWSYEVGYEAKMKSEILKV